MRKGYAERGWSPKTMINTILPIAVGLILGAAGSVLFVLRSQAFAELERSGRAPFGGRRQLTRWVVLGSFAVIAWICLLAAVSIGDVGFIVPSGMIALFASVGLVHLWSVRA